MIYHLLNTVLKLIAVSHSKQYKIYFNENQ